MRYIILAVIAVVILFLVIDYRGRKETSMLKEQIRLHVERAEKANKKLDSLEHEYDLLIIHYRNVSSAYQKERAKAAELEIKYRDEKKKRIGILTDAAYDSVINRLYPR